MIRYGTWSLSTHSPHSYLSAVTNSSYKPKATFVFECCHKLDVTVESIKGHIHIWVLSRTRRVSQIGQRPQSYSSAVTNSSHKWTHSHIGVLSSLLYMGRDSLICATWGMAVSCMTLSHVWHYYLFVRCHEPLVYETYVINVCNVRHGHVLHDPFTCATLLIYLCGITYVTVVLQLQHTATHMCDITYLHVWHNTCTGVAWHSYTVGCRMHSAVWMCSMTHSYVSHDLFLHHVLFTCVCCVTHYIPMCMLHHSLYSYVVCCMTHSHESCIYMNVFVCICIFVYAYEYIHTCT